MYKIFIISVASGNYQRSIATQVVEYDDFEAAEKAYSILDARQEYGTSVHDVIKLY